MSKTNKHVLFSLTVCAFITSMAPAMAKTILPGGAAFPAECTTYDPTKPPPGWPETPYTRWSEQLTKHKGNVKTVCNLLVPLNNIDAKSAFITYQDQTYTNKAGQKFDGAVFIDVRTPEEYRWVGAPAQLNSFTTKRGAVVTPDRYLATLNTEEDALRLEYTVGGTKKYTQMRDVMSTALSPVAHNVPVEYIDPITGDATLNANFGKQVDDLAAAREATNVIFYCRSGDRSSVGCYYKFCPMALMGRFMQSQDITFHEVEGDVAGNGNGGFEGSTGSNIFIGYRGFPGRGTEGILGYKSVSFKDLGLPMLTSLQPPTVKYDSTGPIIDTLIAPWALR